MYSGRDLIPLIRRAAVEAVEQGAPAGVLFGTVVSVSPLAVQVDQKLTLQAPQLRRTALVRDFTVRMAVEHVTEENEGGSPPPHLHAYRGEKSFTVRLGLKTGERVVLLREQGGQKYLILDRVVDG